MNKRNYLQIIRQQHACYVANNVYHLGRSKLKICKREKLKPNFVRFKIPDSPTNHYRPILNRYRRILIDELKIKEREFYLWNFV